MHPRQPAIWPALGELSEPAACPQRRRTTSIAWLAKLTVSFPPGTGQI